jgi:SHS2 domain-containing protein
MSESPTQNEHWEHFSHVADIGIRGYGDSLEQAFEKSAIALTAVICDPATVRSEESVQITCEAPDKELLLTEWLNALVYEIATRKMLFSGFQVNIYGLSLQGTAWGEAIDRSRHRPAVEVKGATYTELRVYQREDGQWVAQCVIDV